MLHRPPGGQGQALHGPEHPALEAGVLLVQRLDQLLDLLALGVAVRRAGVEHHGQMVALGGVAEHPLPAVEQGADLGNAGAVQVGHGLEAGQPPLVKQGEEEGLHRVVEVVAQGDLGDAVLLQGVVEGAPAHLGAHGAGVLLLAQIKDDVVDFAVEQREGHVQLPAQGLHPGEVHPLSPVHMAHIQGVGLHGKGLGVELPQPGQGHQQGQGVLAPGHPHRHPVPGLDHVVVLHTAADIAQNLVHRHLKNQKSKQSIQEYLRDFARLSEHSYF